MPMRLTLKTGGSGVVERWTERTTLRVGNTAAGDHYLPPESFPALLSAWRFPWQARDDEGAVAPEQPGDEARAVATALESADGVDPDADETFLDLVDVEPGVKAKPEANLTALVPELREKFQIIFAAYKKYGYADSLDNPVVITSGNDSDEHVPNSYHYKNRAIDVRGKHVPDKTLVKIAKSIQSKIGAGFRVWAELFSSKHWYRDHIHIEYRGATLKS